MAAAIEAKQDELRQNLSNLKDDLNNILNYATAENRELSPNEVSAVEALQSDYEAKERELSVYQKQGDIERHSNEVMARVTEPDDLVEEPEPEAEIKMQKSFVSEPANSYRRVSRARRLSEERVLASANHGFNNVGDWAQAVVKNSVGGALDPRLEIVRAQQQESVGADGGFLIPPGFTNQLVEVVLGDSASSLAARCWQVPIQANNTRIPLNMDVPYSGGIRAYWGAEASTHTRSQANIELANMTMHKVTALVPVTEELMEDAPAIGSLISSKAPQAIAWEVGDAIINGDGQNKPQGILNTSTAAMVTVPKETNQTAATIVKQNIYKMMSHLPAASQVKSVWLASPTAQRQLWDLLQTNRGDPGKGLEVSPYESLLQRPIIQHLALQNLGTKGDVILADLSQYIFIYKSSGVRTAMSMHMMFDQDISMLKFQMRCNGLPAWSKQIDVPHGSHKLSPFATLAARS